MMHYQEGNTVRLLVEFKDWDNQPVDPDLVKLIILDNSYKKVEENSVGPANRLGEGMYYFDYVTKEAGDYIYEWYAEIDGTPSLKRERIFVRKV
ncbi:hypothetical protein [Desertibacillus haloalkaliphilus]|uniref:hypothetical protein n=1 Tax=Desertibacillus haloalkaliphilus TaxID=1328930 RepID=UPI001C26248D|nr:hypothetical protein [Desertibacillus haloalkaliphilus]MBU8908489.1 hypothetical protein [Desertibacillus haloalkaliphilus]